MPVWFDTPTGKDIHGQIAITQEGRLIAWGKNYVVSAFTNGLQAINVRIPDLRMVEYVLNVQFHEDPLDTSGNAYGAKEAKNKKITGNVVGMTVWGNAYSTGTTLIVEVIAIGPP